MCHVIVLWSFLTPSVVQKGKSVYGEMESCKGYFFANEKEGMIWYKNWDMDILDRLARIQQLYPDLIRHELEVREEYG